MPVHQPEIPDSCILLAMQKFQSMEPHDEMMIFMLGPTCSNMPVMTCISCTFAAKALIPDDDDEELIEKAKANRKTRLQTEKVAEKEYAKSGGFADSEVVAVQASAVLGLSLSLSLIPRLVLAASSFTHCPLAVPCFGCREQDVLAYWRDLHCQLCIIARST